jgi:hypothetical protein
VSTKTDRFHNKGKAQEIGDWKTFKYAQKNQHRPYTDVLLVTYLPTDFFVSVAKSVSHWFLIISIQFLTHIAFITEQHVAI